MYNEQIEALISAALADGVLTEKEKQILFKKAQSMGIDLDEFEMVLDARLEKLKNKETANFEAAYSTQMLFEKLQKLDPTKAKDHEKKRSIWLKREHLIENFPIPNTKEELLDWLVVSTNQACSNSGDSVSEVWLGKADMVYQKIIICASNDDVFLEQASEMIFSLMRRLPKKYWNFTKVPANQKGYKELQAELQAKFQAEQQEKRAKLQAEQQELQQELQNCEKRYPKVRKGFFIKFGSLGLVGIILGLIFIIWASGFLWFIGWVSVIAGICYLNKLRNELNDLDYHLARLRGELNDLDKKLKEYNSK